MNSSQTATAGASHAAGANADPSILRAENIHKHYRLGKVDLHVLRGCNLTVRTGEFLAIMGKSGSGKSTLLHILGALDVPQRGQLHFHNQAVFAPEHRRRTRTTALDALSESEKRRNAYRRHDFGFVFQFYHLLPELNVLENVTLPRMVALSVLQWQREKSAARRRAAELLERFGLGDRLKHKPAELSGGERQRVAIARALVHQPQVLLADEPTGNLDAEAGAGILDILEELHADGQTTVMVTHDPSVAQRADRMLTLEQGRL